MMMERFEQRIAQVREDREHGSRWLVRQAIIILRDIATSATAAPGERLRLLRLAGNELARARPAMFALAGAVIRILGSSENPDEIARAAEQLLHEYETVVDRITDHTRPLLHGTLMTHSLSGTVLEVLTACVSTIEQVIVLEGRPRYEGREVALALQKAGIATTLITDAQADIFLSRCRAVIVGADSVLANGDILNKAGTALLAWAAHGHGVPLYVLCETLKIATYTWQGDLAQLEEKEAEEVWEHPAQGINVHNFYFDHTPARLVTKLITERGILSKQDIRQTASDLKRMAKRAKLTQTF
ncbi:MAG TPA: translation initiation factor eIF-2B [Ktedonobacteraceae bacterium]